MAPLQRRRRLTSSGAIVALTATVLLAGCGAQSSTGPRFDPFGPAPASSSPAAVAKPSATASPTASATASATASPVPTPSAVQPAPRSTSKRASGGSAKDTAWVGTFRGQKVKVPRGHGAPISFTFDDGPSPVFTPQVLALLAKNDVPAVFCVIGQQVRAYPKLVRREVKAGHVLCDHSRDHDISMNRKGQAYVTGEVADGLAAVRAASPGTPVHFYRQPGGTWSPLVVRAMHQSKLTPLRWTDDPRDWSRPGSRAIVHRVVAGLTPGGVILMHDGGGDRAQTVEALAWLLPSLQAAGWVPVLAPQHKISDKAAARPQ